MDDLQRELRRLETTLAETAPDSRVIDELATMRGDLARPAGDSPFRLANVRIASPCKERWADMTGDDRVRVCNGCDRPVFNLSEMTRDQAEAVLATRGIKPCVRFYRRVDGTVMTSDCPPGARRSHRLTVITAGTLLGASPAMADPAGEPPAQTETTAPTVAAIEPEWEMGDISDDPDIITAKTRPAIEWSTWLRGGLGVASHPATLTPRTTTAPPLAESSTLGEGALGVDVSVGVARRGAVRLGGFAEMRTVSEPVLGGELIVGGLPRHPDGKSMGVVLRGGGNKHLVTGAFGVGYTASDPWLGFGHAANLRLVSSLNRSVDDPREWSITLGFEIDPIGAAGYIVRSRD